MRSQLLLSSIQAPVNIRPFSTRLYLPQIKPNSTLQRDRSRSEPCFHKSSLVNIAEIGVLAIRQVLKGVRHVLVSGLVNTSGSELVAALVLPLEVPAEIDEHDDEKAVAAKVGGESGEVFRRVVLQEDLRALYIICVSRDKAKAPSIDRTYQWRYRHTKT